MATDAVTPKDKPMLSLEEQVVQIDRLVQEGADELLVAVRARDPMALRTIWTSALNLKIKETDIDALLAIADIERCRHISARNLRLQYHSPDVAIRLRLPWVEWNGLSERGLYERGKPSSDSAVSYTHDIGQMRFKEERDKSDVAGITESYFTVTDETTLVGVASACLIGARARNLDKMFESCQTAEELAMWGLDAQLDKRRHVGAWAIISDFQIVDKIQGKGYGGRMLSSLLKILHQMRVRTVFLKPQPLRFSWGYDNAVPLSVDEAAHLEADVVRLRRFYAKAGTMDALLGGYYALTDFGIQSSGDDRKTPVVHRTGA